MCKGTGQKHHTSINGEKSVLFGGKPGSKSMDASGNVEEKRSLNV
jgi:hypothetical protein